MDLGSLLLGVALLVAVAFIIARPLLERARSEAGDAGPAEALMAERERVLAALRDLDFDHAMGKLLDDDYQAQRARLVADGATILRQLDALPSGRAPEAVPGTEPTAADLDRDIEQAIKQRRARTAAPAPRRNVDAEIEATVAERRQGARFCSQCGQPVRPDDRFCGACGAPVRAPEAAQ